jgi:predicted amidophosphoribosyltransferase
MHRRNARAGRAGRRPCRNPRRARARADLDVVEPLAHALRDLARQERDVVEGRGATVENPLQAARIIGRTARFGGSWGHDNLRTKSAKYTRSIPETFTNHQCNGSRRFAGVAASLGRIFALSAFLDRTYEATGVAKLARLAARGFCHGAAAARPDARHRVAQSVRIVWQFVAEACCVEAATRQYWNERALRCPVCAVPLLRSVRIRWQLKRGVAGVRDCVAGAPHFDATLALADYRAPLDTLALDLKFRARLNGRRVRATLLARLRAGLATHRNGPMIVAPVPLVGDGACRTRLQPGVVRLRSRLRAAPGTQRRYADRACDRDRAAVKARSRYARRKTSAGR